MKDTSISYAAYHDIFLNIDTVGRLQTRIYNKRDDFNFIIINHKFIAVAYTICFIVRYLNISINT